MEYRNSEQRCEKWYTPARWHKNLVEHKTVNGNPDFHCLVKSGRCRGDSCGPICFLIPGPP